MTNLCSHLKILLSLKGESMRRNTCMDVIKGIACIAVVLIHYNWSNEFGSSVKTLCRFAVPYFFFVSGYYLKNSQLKLDATNIKRKFYNILKLTLKSALVYSVFCIIWNLLMNHQWNLTDFIAEKISFARLLKLIITNDPFVYAHFWYLLALMSLYVCMYVCRNKFNDNLALMTAIFFMFGFSALSEFNSLLSIRNSFPIADTGEFLMLYNLFCFRAMPFFLLGIWFRENNYRFQRKVISEFFFIIMILAGCILALIENKLFGVSQFYIGSYITVLVLIFISIQYPDFNIAPLNYIGNKLSVHIYIYHILIGKIYDLLAKKYNWYNDFMRSIRPFLVCATSILLSWLIVKSRDYVTQYRINKTSDNGGN